MTMEEALAVIQKIKNAWAAFGQSMAEAAQALEDMFRNLGERAINSGLSGMGYLQKTMACLFIGGFVQLLLATNLSPWHLEIDLTSGVHFEEQTWSEIDILCVDRWRRSTEGYGRH